MNIVRTIILTTIAATFLSGRVIAAAPYAALIAFGHSWTDTGRNPPSGNYWNGRYSNGPLWVEYFSTNLGLAYAPANNFAVAGATSADVLNSQIPFYQPTTNTSTSLFVIWSYENDFNTVIFEDGGSGLGRNLTNDTFWGNIILKDIANTSNSIVTLYNKGARSLVVPNMIGFDDQLGNGSYYMVPDSTRAVLGTRSTALNDGLTHALDAIQQALPDLRIFRFDFHTLLHSAVLQYRTLGFTTANISVLDDTTLNPAYKTFTGPGYNYLWWDQLHPTTKFHKVWANWMLNLVTNTVLERLELAQLANSSELQMSSLSPGHSYTLQNSSDLRVWANLSSFVPTAGTNSIPLANLGQAVSFYRLHRDN
jgi:phospholipase/lecithinase/hemolysin